MRLILPSVLSLVLLIVPACAYPPMNTVEFEHHLEERFGIIRFYGVGYEGYENSDEPNSIRAMGFKSKGIYASTSVSEKLVHLESPRILIGTREGERVLLPLRWVGEVPPKEFTGKLFIRVFNLEEGLLHWDPEPFATWDYEEAGD